MTGWADPAVDTTTLTFLPGTFADHLTSYAATFDTSSQTKMSRWINAFPVGMNSAHWTEAMLNNVLIEGVGASRIFGGKQAKIGAWNKPQKRSST